MKRIILTYALSLGSLFAALPLGARPTLPSGATVAATEVRRLRDSVVVRMRFDLSGMKVESNRSVVLIPLLEADGERIELPSVEVMGRRRQLYYERNGRQPYADNPWCVIRCEQGEAQTVEYRTSLLYEPWMDAARLEMAEDLCGCGEVWPNGRTVLQQVDVAFRPRLAYIAPEVEVEKRRALSGEAYLDFVVNRTEINPTYRRNPEELAYIHASLDTILHNRDIRITRIALRGYASPEGTYRNNSRLAEGRTEALRQYIKARHGFADTLFTTDFVPENWEGLRRCVAGSSLPERDSILALIDSDREPDVKEQAIRNRYPEAYATLLAECYPGLRRTDYRIDYTVRGFSVNEAKDVLRTRPQNLSLDEMFAVAQTYTPGSDDFNRVFDVAVRMYPDSEVANLNAANALLEQGLTQQAQPYLDKAGKSAQALNARGVSLLLQGRYDEAQPLLEQALQGGVKESEANMEIMKDNDNSHIL